MTRARLTRNTSPAAEEHARRAPTPPPGVSNAALSRRLARDAPAAAPEQAAAPTQAAGLLVDDGAQAESHQLAATAFLAEVRQRSIAAAREELGAAAAVADVEGEVERALAPYRGLPAAKLESTLRAQLPEAANARAARELVEPIVGRVRAAARERRPQLADAAAAAGDSVKDAVKKGVDVVTSAVGSGVDKLKSWGKALFSARPGAGAAGEVGDLGRGAPLEGTVRARMEPLLGDLSHVSVHHDAAADAEANRQGARALAIGEHVAFAAGEYRPGTPAGDALLAHELAHTQQQQDAAVATTPPTSELERDADSTAVEAVAALHAGGPRRPIARRLRSATRLARCGRENAAPTPTTAPPAPDAGAPAAGPPPLTPFTADEVKPWLALGPEPLAAKLAKELIGDPRSTERAMQVFDGLSMQDILSVVRFLAERHNAGPWLKSMGHLRPRVKAAVTVVFDESKLDAATKAEGVPGDAADELKGYAHRTQWPTAIPRKGQPHPPELDRASEMTGIVHAVERERALVPDAMASKWVPPLAKDADAAGKHPPIQTTPEAWQQTPVAQQNAQTMSNQRGGYQASGSAGGGPAPEQLQVAGNERATEVRKAVWEELGEEGSLSSINTYDNAVVTYGRGFAGSGGLAPFMDKLFERDPTIKRRLLEMGFTRTTEWLALDTTAGCVVAGDEALQLLRFQRRILSYMYSLPAAHAAEMNEAQADVMFAQSGSGDVPASMYTLDDRLLMVIAHCKHWGHMTWPQGDTLTHGKDFAEGLRAVVRWQSNRGGCFTEQAAGKTIVRDWQAELFKKMGRRAIEGTFTTRVATPAEAPAGSTLILAAGGKYVVV